MFSEIWCKIYFLIFSPNFIIKMRFLFLKCFFHKFFFSKSNQNFQNITIIPFTFELTYLKHPPLPQSGVYGFKVLADRHPPRAHVNISQNEEQTVWIPIS